jgi:hypothetical protein
MCITVYRSSYFTRVRRPVNGYGKYFLGCDSVYSGTNIPARKCHWQTKALKFLLTYLLTLWSRVLLEKLTGLQLAKKFPAFHGTQMFVTAFTGARHLCLSWASSIQSVPPHPTSWKSILISSHLRLGLPSGLFPSGFPTKTLYTPLPSPNLACYRGSFNNAVRVEKN